jgi:site-specific DNA-methyltransferase (adenine-specific)
MPAAQAVNLLLGDCLELMRDLPAGSVDAVVTDPPYNVSVKGKTINRGKNSIFQGGNINLDFGEWDHGKVEWTDFIDEFARVITDVGVLVIFYDRLYLGSIGLYLQDKYEFQVRHIGNYIKTNPAPQARKVNWQIGSEMFLVATKNKGTGHHFNYRLGQSPDYFMRSNNYEHLHPTQKPLDLMEWIVKYWSFDGDTILDPFMGSGTTGVACVQTGRNFIGMEIDPGYFEIARKRIEQAQMQERMLL